MKRAHQHPQDLIDLSPEAQGYRDFAAGGHKEADAAALAMANEAAAKERLRQLDEENAALLFGGPLESSALLNATNELTLTSTKQGKDGVVRNTYEGFFKAPEIKTSKLAEPSLLD